MRKIFVVVLFVFLYLLFPKVSFAQDDSKFSSSTAISYKVNADGKTNIENKIRLQNLFSDYYVTSYSLIVAGAEPINVNAFDQNGKIPAEVIKRSEIENEIKVNFLDAVVGQGQTREFTISYTDLSIAKKTGEVWEIEIPKVSSDQFRNYSASLSIPNEMGEVAFIFPEPASREIIGDTTNFYYPHSSELYNGISAAFGQFQVFSFDLTYHLENPINRTQIVDIAVPSDTNYQKIILSKIEPKPSKMYRDLDGNWLAQFQLAPRARIDVKATGHAQLFSTPINKFKVGEEVLSNSLLPSEYWQTNAPEIKKLAEELKTPRAIYDYVTKTLSYDYERVKPNITRLGALEALKNPTNAICMEFTDLFVAIARAAGIPAREINGYAYAENPEIQPLSLVADVLHSWAEYWDYEKQTWVPVDPTWGSTTGGGDYFSKFDLRHFTFVTHGKSAKEPYPPGSYKLGPNPQKDVFVEFSSLPTDRQAKLTLSAPSQSSSIFQDMKIIARLANDGATASYDNAIEVYFDDKKISETTIEALLPLGHEDLEIKVPVNFLGQGMPEKVRIVTRDQEITVETHREIVIISNLSLIFLIFFVILLFALVKFGKLKLPKLTINLPWKPNTPVQ